MLRSGTEALEGQRKTMSKEAATRVVLADDHSVVRQGLKRLLNRAPDVEVIGEAADGLEAIHSVQELHPDVLLLDIEMPVMDGIEVARRLREMGMKVRILILSAYDDREYISALLATGVSGYLVKGESPGKIIEAVRGVAKDQKGWVSPQVRKKLEKMQESPKMTAVLTINDLAILRLLADNASDTTIAEKIGASVSEAAEMVETLLRKIGAQTRQQAVEISLREGWISR